MEGEPSHFLNPFQKGTLTDAEILEGGPDLLRTDNLLQVAATHTNAEIIEVLNAGHDEPVMTADQLHQRITRTLTNIAKRDGRTRDAVKADFEETRLVSGATKRRYAHASAKSAASRVANLTRQRAGADEATGERDSSGDAVSSDETPDLMEVDDESDDSTDFEDLEEQLRQKEVYGLFENSTMMDDDDVLQLAGKFTVAEIVDHLNDGRTIPEFVARMVKERIEIAVANMALRKGKAVQDIRADLEATRRAEGVTKRARAQAKRKCKPSFPLLNQFSARARWEHAARR